MYTITQKDIDRFLSKFVQGKEDECWEWILQKGTRYYGQFGLLRHMEKAHRISYEVFIGEIPVGMCVLHSCDNPPCVNPKHLFLGTNSDNVADKMRKGRFVSTGHLTNKMVIQISTGIIFHSVYEASAFSGYSEASVYRSCHGLIKTITDFKFYTEEK